MIDEKEVTEQLEKAKAEAADEARVSELARLKSLQDAFPDDAEFALAQYVAGATVETAKAEYADVVSSRAAEMSAKLSALEQENADLKAQLAQLTTAQENAGAPLPHGEGGSAADDPISEKANELQAAHPGWTMRKCRVEARRILSRESKKAAV